MQTLSRILFFVGLLMFISNSVESQILKKIKEKAENKILNKTEEGANKTKEEPAENNEEGGGTAEEEQPSEPAAAQKSESTLSSFANYDFVPGDKIIFFYDMAGEQDAEIPGRMLVNDGNVEVQTYNGEKVLLVPKNANLSMVPAMKTNNYLPE